VSVSKLTVFWSQCYTFVLGQTYSPFGYLSLCALLFCIP
jgi:hypothetical protein